MKMGNWEEEEEEEGELPAMGGKRMARRPRKMSPEHIIFWGFFSPRRKV